MSRNEQMIDIRSVVSRHRALAILRLLVREELRGRTNDAVLLTLLDKWGLGGSQDVIRTQIGLLEELGLVTVEAVDYLLVVDLTRQGHEVANGTTRAEGVEPYGPESPYGEP